MGAFIKDSQTTAARRDEDVPFALGVERDALNRTASVFVETYFAHLFLSFYLGINMKNVIEYDIIMKTDKI